MRVKFDEVALKRLGYKENIFGQFLFKSAEGGACFVYKDGIVEVEGDAEIAKTLIAELTDELGW